MRKKIVLGLAAVMMVAGLTGCGNKNPYIENITYSDYVKLCDYKGVEASKVTYEVTEDEVQEAINEDLYEYVTYDEITDRAAQNGDCANITYTTMIDGEESENYSGEGEDIVIGEGYIFPEVEEALVDMNTGDKKKVDVEISDDYAYEEDDVGKKATVEIALNEISQENMPELNDDFVKENTDYKNKAEYEEAKRKELEQSKEDEYRSASVQEIMEFLLDNCEFNGYPDDLYKQCEENYNNENAYNAAMWDMELSEFEEALGLDEETKKQEIETSVNAELIIGAIAQAEKAVERQTPMLLDVLAVESTLSLLDKGEKGNIIAAVKAVYFVNPSSPLRRGDISNRVRRFAITYPTDERTAYRWLKYARLLCAAVRGLRISDADERKYC